MILKNENKPILIVCGTRPEIIKLAPLYVSACKAFGDDRVKWVSTGQHQALEEQTLRDFGIVPTVRLKAATSETVLTDLHDTIVRRLGRLIDQTDPALVIVQGDTISAFSGAFTAFHKRIPVAHVEAGLRTYDNDNPYPEEAYRRMIDAMASLHFAATLQAAEHLRDEGCEDNFICVTGNTVIDALSMVDVLASHLPTAELPEIPEHHRLILATMHRRESWDGALASMCRALMELVEKYDDIHILFPLHINPRVQEQVRPILENHPRITLLPPLNFVACHHLISNAFLILTDSGGIQEEAPSYAVPVLVLRQLTERQEAVAEGIAILTGTDKEDLVETASRLLDDSNVRSAMRRNGNPFGDGKASERIVLAIGRFLRNEEPLLHDEEEFHHKAPDT